MEIQEKYLLIFCLYREYHYLALCDKRNAHTIYMERNSKHHAQTKDKTRE